MLLIESGVKPIGTKRIYRALANHGRGWGGGLLARGSRSRCCCRCRAAASFIGATIITFFIFIRIVNQNCIVIIFTTTSYKWQIGWMKKPTGWWTLLEKWQSTNKINGQFCTTKQIVWRCIASSSSWQRVTGTLKFIWNLKVWYHFSNQI